jgi:NAD+ diphosphatase
MITVRGVEVALTEICSRPELPGTEPLFVGTVWGRHCWAMDADAATDQPGPHQSGPEGEFVDLMRLFGRVDEPTWAAAGRAVQLVEWARTHRFCGRCGAATVESPGERARRCLRCGLLAFPRLAPAIITLVERSDGCALLARNARWPTRMYSCLAGFVEPGESLEATVHREVEEEVGIQVDDLRYCRSQPWPFPHSLMLGFHARYKSGEINCDGSEIADAGWFSPRQLPDLPGPISIARWLIDDWVARSR